MEFLKVYNKIDFEPVKAQGAYVWDKNGEKYLDFYGGHAVISIGHRHPLWVQYLKEQIDQIPFYSNAVQKGIEDKFARLLGEVSGYNDYGFFACNSGAEAVENALKLASFHTGKDKVLAFSKAFHGRTSAAVSVSDYPNNVSPLNKYHKVVFSPLNDTAKAVEIIEQGDLAAVIVEGIQGVGGVHIPTKEFLSEVKKACDKNGTLLILDEVQSGYGRSGKFFAHQHAGVKADLIPVAKGMGNGFPMGGVLVSPEVEYKTGQLGSTFGGNHMALAAGIAVLEVIQSEKLIENAALLGAYLIDELSQINAVSEVRGQGLMIALELPEDNFKEVKNNLLFAQKLLTGQSGKNILRLLPPLNITKSQADQAVQAIQKAINSL